MTNNFTQPNASLQRLAPLIGNWSWQAPLDGQPFGNGRTVYEWLEGGAFLVERSDAEQPKDGTTWNLDFDLTFTKQ